MKRAMLSLFLAAALCALAGCSVLYGIVNTVLPDYAAQYPEIEEPSFISHRVYRAYYNDLSDKEKTAYRCIYNNIFSYPKSIEIPDINRDELNNIFEALKYDNPHLIFLSPECSASSSGGKCYFLPKYSMSAEQADEKTADMLVSARKLLGGAAGMNANYYCQLFIHDSLCKDCSYDDNAQNGSNAYGALVEKKALCMGYSYAYKLLLDMSGFDSTVVAGVAHNELSGEAKHMWNAVKTEGKWYHTDVTWDDPSGQDESSHGEVRHCYFNLSDADMLSDHTAFAKPSEIVCRNSDAGYYAREGLLCTNAESALELIRRTVISVAANGDIMAEFRFGDYGDMLSVCGKLFRDGEIYNILAQANSYGAASLDNGYIRYSTLKNLNVLIIFLQYSD